MAKYDKFTDTELLELLKSSDHTAYTEIYNRHFQLIYTHANRKLQDKDQAKDIVQEVFATLWFKRNNLERIQNLTAYLFTATRNKIFDLFAHEQVKQKYIDSFDQFLQTSPSIATDHRTRERDFQAYIDKQIAELPPKMRLIFELSRKQQLSYREIAERLNISENNISKQINNAVRILRTRLGLFLFFLI